MKRWIVSVLAAIYAAAPTWSDAQAQAYPSKPIRIVVPFAAGGTVDTVARTVGAAIAKSMGQPVVVENKPGGGTVIGVDFVAKSAPDGYTLVAIGTSFTVNHTLVPSLPYNSLRDFRPISLLVRTPNVLVGHPRVPANTLSELLAYARANPGKLSYGSIGNGTIQHVAGETLKLRANVDILHVPYKGTPPALADLLGGQIDLMIGNLPELLPQVRSGKLKAFGIATLERDPHAPEIPTIAEQGLPGFESYGWIGLLAPAGVPDAIVTRLNREVVQALNDPELRKSMLAVGFEPRPLSTDEFGSYIRQEVAKYGDVIKRLSMKID